MKVREMH